MAETDSPEMNCVYVDTNLDTHLVVLLHDHETISDFKDKLCKEHHQCFPEIGEIDISAVKVKRQNTLGLLLDYHLPDSMCLSMAFEGISHNCWFVFVEASVRIVDKAALMDAGENCSNHELLEKEKEIPKDSLPLDGYTKIQNAEEDFETGVAEKTTKKRKMKVSDGEKSRKKLKADVSQYAAATTASRFDVVESRELRGDVQVEVVATESSPREKLGEALTEANGKEIEMGEKSVENVGRNKLETVSHTLNHLDSNSGLTARPDTEKKKRQKKRSKDEINQSSAAAITTSGDIVNEINGVPANVDPVDATPESLPILGGEDLGNPFVEASQKDNEMGDNSIDDVGRDQIETDNPASHMANHLDSALTTRPGTEKKMRKKRSKDEINQSSAAALTTSRDIVNQSAVDLNQSVVAAAPTASRFDADENHELPGNVQVEVVATEASPTEKLDEALTEATRKEIEMGEKSVEAVGRDQIETDNLVSHTADHLDTNSELTNRPDTEKKKRRNKRSKDDINQSSALTTSREIVNEVNGVPATVDPVDATPESLPVTLFAESSQKENEMAEKSVGDAGRDNIDETNSGLTSRPDTEKKKKRKKSSKDDNNQSIAAIRASGDIVIEINGVPENVDRVDAEASQKETESGEKNDDVVGGGKAIPVAADNIQPNNVEIDANSVKSTKKRKSRKAKTPAEEDTLIVASNAHNVEPIKSVDGEGPDNVIRNVLDSLQEKNETEENLEKTGKKSSKKSKKKQSLKVAEAQVLSAEVNNAALEKSPPINNTKDTDASFLTPAKKDTKFSEVADNAEDNSLSKKSLIEKADMGDNFGKDDIVGGGAKSIKEKKRLDLHPTRSIDGSLTLMRPKEKKGRVQQSASSGATRLQSRVKNDRSETVKAIAVKSKKEDVKKTNSKPVTVNKRKTNFFEDAEKYNSSEDEYKKTSDVSTKTPSDYSSEDDSDVTFMSRKQGNNMAGGANKFTGSLQDILRRSSSYKKALIRAQSQPDIDDDSPVDFVPDSQGL